MSVFASENPNYVGKFEKSAESLSMMVGIGVIVPKCPSISGWWVTIPIIDGQNSYDCLITAPILSMSHSPQQA